MNDHEVSVLAERDGSDLIYRLVTNKKVSDLYRSKGRASSIGGNPYLLYGDAIEEFTGIRKYDVNITVFMAISGTMVKS